MNKSLLLIESINLLLETSTDQIVYDSSKGIKLIRYGGKDRFSQPVSTHYNQSPLPRGTWASIYPYNMLAPFPEPHNKIYQNLTDQTSVQKNLYHSNTGSGILKPVYFFWNHEIYSHIDKTGSYQNKGWTFYPNVKDLVHVISSYGDRLKQSIDIMKTKSTNIGYPNSTETYYKSHEYEVFVPSENIRKS